MRIKIIILFFLFSGIIFSQNSSNYSFELFPSGKHILPFKTNYQEARMGILYYPSNGNLKVDLGNSVDLIKFFLPSSNVTFTMGAEFMGYALSTSYKEKRLQIDALDGFFGGNISFSKNNDNGKLFFRFRIIHNSAHLVDGSYDREEKKWINDYEPIPFTRDFGEISVGYELEPSFGIFRTYGAVSYSTLVRPLEIKKWAGYIGYELAFCDLIGKMFNSRTNLFLSSQLNLAGMPDYKLSANLMGGIKFGNWNGKGLVIYLSYYNGFNPFSEYYFKRVRNFGIGFFVDFI